MSKKSKTTAVEVNDERRELAPLDFDQAEGLVEAFRSRYDGRQKEASLASAISDTGPGRTRQAHKDDCDINVILRKYAVTGVLPDMSRAALAKYGDFSNVPSYERALDVVIEAEEAFASLPSELRNRFQNDPGQLLAFLGDTNNREEAIKLGLIDPATLKVPAVKGEQSDPAPAVPATPVTPSGSNSGGKA